MGVNYLNKDGLIDMNCLTVTTYLVDAKFATFTPIDSVIDHALDVQYASLISHPPNHGLACIPIWYRIWVYVLCCLWPV